MKKIIYLLLLLPVLSYGQETWNACNSTVSQVPKPAYDSTFVLSAPSRAALAKGMANWEPARSYKVYTALLTQSGTDAPVATVLENTLGGEVVWSYIDVGVYEGVLAGAFVDEKTWCSGWVSISDVGTQFFAAKLYRVSNDAVRISIGKPVSESAQNSALSSSSFEIRVYP
jgi:hypothetical protein